MADCLVQLKQLLNETADLAAAEAVLSWDQHTYMPPGGSLSRAEQLSTLQKFAHRLLTSAELRNTLDGAEAEAQRLPEESEDRALVAITRHDLDEALKLPESLVVEELTSSLALEAWSSARRDNSYATFAPWLQKTIDLEKQVAECRGYEGHPYGALLQAYERGACTEDVKVVFGQLKDELRDLIERIAASPVTIPPLPDADYPVPLQSEIAHRLARTLGYDFDRGRIDSTVHPFATAFTRDDVRITVRYDQRDPTKGIFAALHESGHAMYEQGIARSFDRTPLAGGASLGVHESQSRLWENVVGRSLPFWQVHFPDLQRAFPEPLGPLSVEQFYRSINRVRPSMIRVDADEVTYNLHVLVRFEMEMDLIDGRISVAEAPEAWNTRMFNYLGIRPQNDTAGILQDVHWSMGAIGYFPTYTLGSLLACQLWDAAVDAQPGIPAQIAAGDCSGLLGWLRTEIHQHGRRYLPADLVVKATGRPLSPAPFLKYLKEKYSALYALGND